MTPRNRYVWPLLAITALAAAPILIEPSTTGGSSTRADTAAGSEPRAACSMRFVTGVNTLDEDAWVLFDVSTHWRDVENPLGLHDPFRRRDFKGGVQYLGSAEIGNQRIAPGEKLNMPWRDDGPCHTERRFYMYVSIGTHHVPAVGTYPVGDRIYLERRTGRDDVPDSTLPAATAPGGEIVLIELGDPACWATDRNQHISWDDPVTGCADEEDEDETPADLGPLRITNLRSGPVCEAGTAEIGRAPSDRICPDRDIAIRGKDTCVFDGEEKRCTWWGFEFDYENADPEEPLVCVWTRSLPVNEGNYEEVRSRSIATDTVRYDLEGTSGHFFFPGFDTFPEAFPYPWMTVDAQRDCSYRDRHLFQLNHRLLFSNAFD